jgi:hypothetical protein
VRLCVEVALSCAKDEWVLHASGRCWTHTFRVGASSAQSVSGVSLADSVRQLNALDERVRAAASAAWSGELSKPVDDLLGGLSLISTGAASASADTDASLFAVNGESSAQELSSALALAQQLLARQRAETQHWRSEAARWHAEAAGADGAAGSVNPFSGDAQPESPGIALASARLELARTRELLTQVSAERDALRVRLMALQEMGYHQPAAAASTHSRQRGHSGLLRAAAEELAAHSAAREAAAVAATQAAAFVIRVGGGVNADGGGGLDSPTTRSKLSGGGDSPSESAARVRERMLRLSGENPQTE